MKNLLTISTLLIAFTLTACSTSTQPEPENPERIGTWRIDSRAHATWMGSSQPQLYKVAFDSSGVDTTAQPDTTYFFSNDSLQAELTEISGEFYKGDFEFKITDETTDKFILDSLNVTGVTAQNLGNAFTVEGYLGSELRSDDVTFKIQTSFNCQSTNDNTQNLRLAFLSTPDSLGVQDTVMVYEMSTNGLYSTARHITCQN